MAEMVKAVMVQAVTMDMVAPEVEAAVALLVLHILKQQRA